MFKGRENFDFVFEVMWNGTYFMTRAFLEMLKASSEGALVNTSSNHGFHANNGVAYSTAKFAIRGFSEGLIADFRKNAPHLSVHCVMPGFIETSIGLNGAKLNYEVRTGKEATQEQMENWEKKIGQVLKSGWGLSQADAATLILNGVEDGLSHILVGDDVVALDKGVRKFELGAFYPLEDKIDPNEANQ